MAGYDKPQMDVPKVKRNSMHMKQIFLR